LEKTNFRIEIAPSALYKPSAMLTVIGSSRTGNEYGFAQGLTALADPTINVLQEAGR
jgi:hypothetical protein